jgi:hypothetical protein
MTPYWGHGDHGRKAKRCDDGNRKAKLVIPIHYNNDVFATADFRHGSATPDSGARYYLKRSDSYKFQIDSEWPGYET